MTDETIVAIYDTPAHANLAAADLKAAGMPESAISVHAEASGSTATTTAPTREKGFWSNLFGGEPDHDTSVYDRSVTSGSTVVTVKAPEMHVTQVTQILESHHPIDIDERATGYGLTQTTAMTQQPRATAMPTAPSNIAAGTTETVQLSEESLVVGKRVVNRGSTRIRRFVVETPVEQTVTLHDEKVMLERRPVTDSRPVSDADFTDKTIEMTETAEEAVVGKTARVVEEVAVHKEAVDRTETVRDTVRKEDVEIEKIPAATTTTTGTTSATTVSPVAPKI